MWDNSWAQIPRSASHTEFSGRNKCQTVLRLAEPWPQLCHDEKKTQEEVSREITPSRFQCSSSFVCGFLNFRPSENHWFQVMFLRWYLFSSAKLKPVNCCFQAPGKKKSPWRVVWDAHPSCWSAAAAGKVQDSILCLHPSPQHWLLYFFI